MEFIGILAVILFIYVRTHDSYKLIDDPVPRSGYLREGPRAVHYSFYDNKKPLFNTVVNIGTFIATTAYIYILWGWKAALLYAVLPTNVSGVAWTTGNYYMTTVLFTLTAYWLLQVNTVWAVIGAMLFYYAALHSTISAIPFAFYMAWTGNYWMLPILLAFLCGDRFRGGLKLRKEDHEKKGQVAGEFNWKSIFVVPKTIAYYIVLNCYPARLGFFHTYGKTESDAGRLYKPSEMFWLSLSLIAVFWYVGSMYDIRMVIWWFLFIGIFSQFTTFGQFIAERYMYLANVGWCVLAAKFLQVEWLYASVAALYLYRTLLYVPAYKHNRTLFNYGVTNFPACPENYLNLSSFYIERGAWRDAIKPLLCSIQFTSGNKSGLYMNLANAYASNGQFDKALYYNELASEKCRKDHVKILQTQKYEFERKLKRNRRIMKQLQEI